MVILIRASEGKMDDDAKELLDNIVRESTEKKTDKSIITTTHETHNYKVIVIGGDKLTDEQKKIFGKICNDNKADVVNILDTIDTIDTNILKLILKPSVFDNDIDNANDTLWDTAGSVILHSNVSNTAPEVKFDRLGQKMKTKGKGRKNKREQEIELKKQERKEKKIELKRKEEKEIKRKNKEKEQRRRLLLEQQK